MSELTHTTASVNVSILPGIKSIPVRNSNDVDFMVKYPEGYTGNRIMPEGVTIVSKEVAEQFTKLGIGSVAASEKQETEVTSETVSDTKTYEGLTKDQLKAELTAREIVFDPKVKNADLVALLVANDVGKAASEKQETEVTK